MSSPNCCPDDGPVDMQPRKLDEMRSPPAGDSDDVVDYMQQALTSARKAAYFWGSLTATVVPGYFGRKMGLVHDFLHWNFITDRCILGALPVVTKFGDSGNHLVQLAGQLRTKDQELGLVVACMEEIEIQGFGVPVITFADETAWRQYVNPDVEYCHVPLEDATADVSFDVVVSAVEQIYQCVDVRKETAYIHCKAGKGRSWMMVMCYLTTYGNMKYADAENLVRANRPQVSPSQPQRDFAMCFAQRMKACKNAASCLTRSQNV